jgi:hypothetical protein
VKRAGRAVELRAAPKARKVAHPQERQHSAPEGGTRGPSAPKGDACAARVRDRNASIKSGWRGSGRRLEPDPKGRVTVVGPRMARPRARQVQEHRWNTTRDFLGTFCRQPSVLLPRFPFPFPLPAPRGDVNCP